MAKNTGGTRLRAGIVGLGWMGWLYDVAARRRPAPGPGPTRPPTGLPALRPGWERDPQPTSHPGKEGLPEAYAAALALDPRTELVAGCDPDDERRAAFGARYGVSALYADFRQMLRRERLDLVVAATRTDLRPAVVSQAIECGARCVIVEKPLAHTLLEADRMVEDCAVARVPLVCGAISVNHPAFERAKELVDSGTIGRLVSVESSSAAAQHNPWLYLVGRSAEWAMAADASSAAVEADREFDGTGVVRFRDALQLFLRPGAPAVRLTGERGEIIFDWQRFRIWLDVDGPGGVARVEVPWGDPQMHGDWSCSYAVDEAIRCLDGAREPRASGRRVRDAMEIEIALRESHRRGDRVALPLADRSLGMRYEWFR